MVGSISPAIMQPITDGPTCVTELSLVPCLVIEGLFMVLTTVIMLFLSFDFVFFYTRGTRQPLHQYRSCDAGGSCGIGDIAVIRTPFSSTNCFHVLRNKVPTVPLPLPLAHFELVIKPFNVTDQSTNYNVRLNPCFQHLWSLYSR